jgi:NAD(P)-dependent dehydrogenase (short-subunit alcohol dehydrogenase family)
VLAVNVKGGKGKHAVVGLTRVASLELAPDGIRVNAVCPSPIDTAMTRELEGAFNPANPAAFHQRMAGTIPLRRYGSPEEVAALVAFLCSADAAYITGGSYPVDSGSMA